MVFVVFLVCGRAWNLKLSYYKTVLLWQVISQIENELFFRK